MISWACLPYTNPIWPSEVYAAPSVVTPEGGDGDGDGEGGATGEEPGPLSGKCGPLSRKGSTSRWQDLLLRSSNIIGP